MRSSVGVRCGIWEKRVATYCWNTLGIGFGCHVWCNLTGMGHMVGKPRAMVVLLNRKRNVHVFEVGYFIHSFDILRNKYRSSATSP